MKTKIDIELMGNRIWDYTCSLYQPNERFPYPLQAGQPGSLYGSAFAAFIAHMLGRANELPGRDRIICEIRRIRNIETGLFDDPDVKLSDYLKPDSHSELYVSLQTTYFCISALRSLGCIDELPIDWMHIIGPEKSIYQWLTALDWSNPWLVSNLDMFLGIFLLENEKFNDDPMVKSTIADYFRWHNDCQDALTGFWGSQADQLSAMAGAYHIVLHYDYTDTKIGHVKEMIDATLNLVMRDGLFVYGGGGGSCEDMDAIDLLVRLTRLSDYRCEEIRTVLTHAAHMLILGQNSDGGFSWRIQPKFNRMVKGVSLFGFNQRLLFSQAYDFLYKFRYRSHYNSIHNYSSLAKYPFKLDVSDLWSCWFRAISIAFILKTYPDDIGLNCHWTFPGWPGLGTHPFKNGGRYEK